jgi:hypothetical protein
MTTTTMPAIPTITSSEMTALAVAAAAVVAEAAAVGVVAGIGAVTRTMRVCSTIKCLPPPCKNTGRKICMTTITTTTHTITTRCTTCLRFFNSTCLRTRWATRNRLIAAAVEVVAALAAAAASALIFASGVPRCMPAVPPALLPREAGAEVDAAAPVVVWSR